MPEPDWMPVFIASQVRETRHAVHPGNRGKVEPHAPVHTERDLPRVGTAFRQPDGAYLVHLWAVPLTGALLMRPPRRGEDPDPTTKER
jgi:hypothetical protein